MLWGFGSGCVAHLLRKRMLRTDLSLSSTSVSYCLAGVYVSTSQKCPEGTRFACSVIYLTPLERLVWHVKSPRFRWISRILLVASSTTRHPADATSEFICSLAVGNFVLCFLTCGEPTCVVPACGFKSWISSGLVVWAA
jgi:hypothetical protein